MYNDRLVRGIKFQEIHAQKLKESFQAVTKNPLMIKKRKSQTLGIKPRLDLNLLENQPLLTLLPKELK